MVQAKKIMWKRQSKYWAVVATLLLAGCASSGLESAYQLIEQQQSQQALIRQHEAQEWKKNAPNQREIALNGISEVQQQGRYFASLAFIDAYVAEFGRNPEIDVMQAEAFRNTGQLEQSQALYQQLLAGSETALAYRGLGLLAGQQQNYAQAADYLAKAVQQRPTDAMLLSDLGFAQLRSHRLAQARVSLGKAAELEPDNAKVLSNLALYLLLNDQTQQAEELMTKRRMSDQVRHAVHELAYDIQHSKKAVAAPVMMAELKTDAQQAPASEALSRPANESGVVRNVTQAVASTHPSPSTRVTTSAQQQGEVHRATEAPFGFTNSRLIQ